MSLTLSNAHEMQVQIRARLQLVAEQFAKEAINSSAPIADAEGDLVTRLVDALQDSMECYGGLNTLRSEVPNHGKKKVKPSFAPRNANDGAAESSRGSP
jgi:hypothetical protein